MATAKRRSENITSLPSVMRNNYYSFLLLIAASIFSLLYSLLSLIRHSHFQSGAFDLGLYDQAVWHYSTFTYPFNTIKMRMILGDHLTLTLPLLAPLFWIWDDVRILLIFQAVWVSFSILPLFHYLLKRGLERSESLLLCVLYLSFYGMQYGLFFDFHPVFIAVGLLPWLLLWWETKGWKWFIVTTILFLLTQENMGLSLSAVGILWLFEKKRIKLAGMLIALGILTSLISFGAIRLFSDVGLEYTPHLPNNPIEFVTRFFDAPEKRQVLLYSFSWYSFLPLFSIGALLAVTSDLAQYFITGDAFSRMWSPFMHHRAILSLYLLLGVVVILKELKKRKINTVFVVVGMTILTIFQQYYFHLPLNKLAKREFWQEEQWMQDNRTILSKIPQGAAVAAQQSLVPHLSHRKEIYLIYPRTRSFNTTGDFCEANSCWWLDFAGKPDLLVVDTHPGVWLTMTLAEENQFNEALTTMERAHA
ncbi:DUF2079 domain-containing protein, partial [Candidatus Roizmanbacteria bacterium]|nr:DUF2079 domain-containing protein [Candidatus Roizmanbacteria bacterium]